MQALRRRFLHEGQERARQLLLDLDDAFNANEAARAVHQWVGTGGLLGYTALARQAREVQALLLERPVDASQVRESLTNLLLAFSTPGEALDSSHPRRHRAGSRWKVRRHRGAARAGNRNVSAWHWSAPGRGPWLSN